MAVVTLRKERINWRVQGTARAGNVLAPSQSESCPLLKPYLTKPMLKREKNYKGKKMRASSSPEDPGFHFLHKAIT